MKERGLCSGKEELDDQKRKQLESDGSISRAFDEVKTAYILRGRQLHRLSEKPF